MIPRQSARLLVRALGRRRPVRRDRRGAGDVHAVADDDGAREAGDRLVRRVTRDQRALHRRCASIAPRVEALHQIDALGRVRRSLARRGDARRRASSRDARRHATRRVCGSRRSRSRSPPSRRSSRPRRASSTSTSPRARRARRVRHLLAHASGLPFEGETPIAPPGRRRIYSNEGFRVLGEHLAERAEMPVRDYVRAAVVEPLGLGLDPTGHPGAGMHGVARRRARARSRAARAAPRRPRDPRGDGERPVPRPRRRPARLRPLQPARLGARRRAQGRRRPATGRARAPRRARSATSAAAGRSSGSTPSAGIACAALTTREFGDWAKEAWPPLSDAVLDELA